MEFDKRIIDPNDNIWTPFGSTAEQEIYVGLKGYFTDFYQTFENVDNCRYGVLTKIDWNERYPFYTSDELGDAGCFAFFLPERDVKPKEKKYRPFTAEEFINKFPLMSPVIIRNKPDGEILVRCVTGYSKTHPRVYFGRGYNLDVLFNNCEYQDAHGNWLPFGVEE